MSYINIKNYRNHIKPYKLFEQWWKRQDCEEERQTITMWFGQRDNNVSNLFWSNEQNKQYKTWLWAYISQNVLWRMEYYTNTCPTWTQYFEFNFSFGIKWGRHAFSSVLWWWKCYTLRWLPDWVRFNKHSNRTQADISKSDICRG